VERKLPDIVGLLLAKGAKWEPNEWIFRQTPLHFTVSTNIEGSRILLQRGADVNDGGTWTIRPLKTAIETGQMDHIQLLLEHGASIDEELCYTLRMPTTRKWTPDMRRSIVRLLLDKGATVAPFVESRLRRRFSRTVPSIQAVQLDDEEIVRLLLAAGADIKLKDSHGRTAMYHAKKAGASSIIKLLEQANDGASLRWYQWRRPQRL